MLVQQPLQDSKHFGVSNIFVNHVVGRDCGKAKINKKGSAAQRSLTRQAHAY